MLFLLLAELGSAAGSEWAEDKMIRHPDKGVSRDVVPFCANGSQAWLGKILGPDCRAKVRGPAE